jgi:hypothetical protein
MTSRLTDKEAADLYRLRHEQDIPLAEKAEMNASLHQHFIDPDQVSKFQQALPDGPKQSMALLEQVTKAITQSNRTQGAEKGLTRRSAFDDPQMTFQIVPGVVPKTGKIPPEILRTMSAQDPIIEAILQIQKNRTLQHADFIKSGVQAMLEGRQGFDIVPTFKEAWEDLTPAEENERQQVADFLMNSGDAPRFTFDGSPNREDMKREHFEQNLAHLVNQRYVIDAISIEIERNRTGRKLKGLYVVDGGSIYRTDPRSWPLGVNEFALANPKAAYVQMYRNQIVTTLGSEDLYYDYANPRDAIGLRGYGFSETEMSIKLTTGILNVLTTNNAIFDRGAVPPGILYMMGQVNSDSLLAFQEEWDAHRLGAGGAHGLPAMVMNDPNAKLGFLRTDSNPSDMTFQSYVNFLAAIRCAIFGIDVTEINVSPFGGSNGGLNSGKDTQTRIDESKNRAFKPFLSRLERIFNEILGGAWNNRWRFTWVGVEREDPGVLRDTFMKVATVDEMRQTIFKMRPLTGIVGGSLASNPAVSQMTIAALGHGMADSKGEGNFTGKSEGLAGPQDAKAAKKTAETK